MADPLHRLDDPDHPVLTMSQAAELLGVQAAFLRSLDSSGVLSPQRSPGGHRRYSRHQLELAARVRVWAPGEIETLEETFNGSPTPSSDPEPTSSSATPRSARGCCHCRWSSAGSRASSSPSSWAPPTSPRPLSSG